MISEEVRAACAWVAERAGVVQIELGAVEEYARALPEAEAPGDSDPAAPLGEADRETRAAFVLCLDAINFGSGWWPTIRKRPGLSGYSTVETGMVERFLGHGPWSITELIELDPADVADVLGQDPAHPLMEDFARSLRNVGAHVGVELGGRFARLVDAADGSALALADRLASWSSFADASEYEGRRVPFFKRAQLAAADLDRAGVASFEDRGLLTAFADNLVPHVLRVDGVLRLDPALEGAIEAGELLEHGSPAEVELRACTVHAVELLAEASEGCLSPPEIDALLWDRGRDPRYKALPRPRCRNTAY
ncbi:MAG TPA: queuosine salvage family protein [Solirubrobacterales bacterium]|nr:queuosine salvage family protein [Solirubrobacterales bacterium]